ncbi:methyl-accepting chemotaxis protein [Roseimarinus sediminis]|uniref:methyl-accepting chemotaxis protein n=1 Tax=Roseimarinus sediminis TaxID=1610899 RepID=UPI003D262EE0
MMNTFNLLLSGALLVCMLLLLLLYIKNRKLRNECKRFEMKAVAALRINETEADTARDERCRMNEVLASLVLQSPNAIMLMDRDGNIELINEGFTRMYGYTFDNFTKRLGSNYRQTSFSNDVEYRMETVLRTRLPYRYEALNITSEGREVWTQTALVPIVDEQGEVVKLVTIDTDIHQRVVKSDQLAAEIEVLKGQTDELLEQFRYLHQVFSGLFESINQLQHATGESDQILRFIRSISDETRILGFNASIEAARAGEYGRGFRVITNQIIGISHNTIDSINQIDTIIHRIGKGQEELLGRKQESERRIAHFYQLAMQLREALHDIEDAVTAFKSLT